MKLLSVQEVAERLGCSDRHVRRLVWGHQIEHHRLGKIIRISERALDRYLEQTKMKAVL